MTNPTQPRLYTLAVSESDARALLATVTKRIADRRQLEIHDDELADSLDAVEDRLQWLVDFLDSPETHSDELAALTITN